MVINTDGTIKRVHTFLHTDTGQEVSRNFLDQFIGKGPSDAFLLGNDILALESNDSFLVDVTEGITRGVVLVTDPFRR